MLLLIGKMIYIESTETGLDTKIQGGCLNPENPLVGAPVCTTDNKFFFFMETIIITCCICLWRHFSFLEFNLLIMTVISRPLLFYCQNFDFCPSCKLIDQRAPILDNLYYHLAMLCGLIYNKIKSEARSVAGISRQSFVAVNPLRIPLRKKISLRFIFDTS